MASTICKWRCPRTFNNVQHFLGLVQYLAHYRYYCLYDPTIGLYCWILDHQWISDKVHCALPLLCYTSSILTPFYFHPISDNPPFVLVSPFFTVCPYLPVSLISVPMLPWSSCLSHIVSYPIPSSPCFMLVPLFLVPDWVKPNLQHRVSWIAAPSCTLC